MENRVADLNDTPIRCIATRKRRIDDKNKHVHSYGWTGIQDTEKPDFCSNYRSLYVWEKGQIVVEDWPSEAAAEYYLCVLLRIFGISWRKRTESMCFLREIHDWYAFERIIGLRSRVAPSILLLTLFLRVSLRSNRSANVPCLFIVIYTATTKHFQIYVPSYLVSVTYFY